MVSTLLVWSAWLAIWGCYSSNATAPNIPPAGDDDADVDNTPPDADCPPRRIWEGPGVTGIVPVSNNTALVINGDRYVVGEFDMTGGDAADPNVGRLVAWREKGLLSQLWSGAPPVYGATPWQDPGVTAAYLDKTTGSQVIISQFRRWFLSGNTWTISRDPKNPGANPGNIIDDLGGANNAGPPIEDGGTAPWEGIGVTGATFNSTGSQFYLFSKDREWIRTTTDPDPKKWTWIPNTAVDGGGAWPLSQASFAPWNSAPAVGVPAQKPWEGKGVTAVFYIFGKMFVFSADRMWATDGKAWSNSGKLNELDVWKSAPAVECGQ